MDREIMQRAIDLAAESVKKGGGPFGAVVVKDGKVIAESANSVTPDNDPTAHAEVNAIRLACKKLGTFMLDGCEIYASCEPCPMCLGAIYWAHIKTIYYAGTRSDAAKAGFDDDFIYREINIDPEKRSVPAFNFMPNEGAAVFKLWLDKEDRTNY
ncbi:MAG: nucleoside deaminase [Bacteroidales bacterium]|nr:nucleoside deaminase [Bacteroidales bacterium]MBQ3618301.1 nucleoside deaminase [Bacteroidales bacterium]MDD6002499.1 nucleoside deaminase [Bacteroidales bacterium]